MRHIYIIGSIILYLFLLSCTKKQDNRNVVNLKNEIKKECTALKASFIELPQEFIYARYYSVYKDSILIVLNKKIEDIYLIEFHNLKTKKGIRRIFRYGNGPEELLSANININQNLLIVDDYVKKEISFIDIDSITNDPNYKPAISKYIIDARTVVPYNNNKLLMDNPSYFVEPNLGINNETPHFIIADVNKTAEIKPVKQKYYTRNVSDGKIITNYSHNRIYYINSNLPEIELYDNNLNLIKQLVGPDELKINYTIIDNEVVFKKTIPYSYMDYCCNDDYVYTLYMGDFMTEEKRLQDNDLWIFKFDWDGNLINSYSVPQYINKISIGIGEDNLYATGYNDEENPILIKLIQP